MVLAWEELELGFLALIDGEGVVSRDETHEVKPIIFSMYEAIVDKLVVFSYVYIYPTFKLQFSGGIIQKIEM